MRITSADIEAIMLLLKRLFTGLWIGGKYIVVGNVTPSAVTNKEVIVTNTPSKKRRLRQIPPLDIPDEVYEIPAITRLHKVDLDAWETKNLKPYAIDVMIKERLERLNAKGMKPSSLYFDV